MKLFLVLLFIRLFCPNYYTVETVAHPIICDGECFTRFPVERDGMIHLYDDSDLYNGKVHLVMDSKGTDSPIDDTIFAVLD